MIHHTMYNGFTCKAQVAGFEDLIQKMAARLN